MNSNRACQAGRTRTAREPHAAPGRTIRVKIQDRGQGRSAVLLDGEILSVGRVCAAARKLVERGRNPADCLEAWRGSTLCLTGPVGIFARLDVQDGSDGRPRFRPYHPCAWQGRPTGRSIPAEAGVEAGEAAERLQDDLIGDAP